MVYIHICRSFVNLCNAMVVNEKASNLAVFNEINFQKYNKYKLKIICIFALKLLSFCMHYERQNRSI